MKNKCYPVKIKSITARGGAFLIEDYNGNKDFFPASTVYEDFSDIYIAAWILEKKSITYSTKKPYWYNQQSGKISPQIEIIKIVPEKITFDPNQEPNKDLLK